MFYSRNKTSFRNTIPLPFDTYVQIQDVNNTFEVNCKINQSYIDNSRDAESELFQLVVCWMP